MSDEEYTLWDKLAAPFPAELVSWRVGATNGEKTKGLALAYIDARDVMHRLDMFCGPDGWQNRYSHANGKTVCDIGIRVTRADGTVEWVWKADGAGDSDVEAEKGALSDAFKRAAVRWGVGRYLYGIQSVWVAIEAHGRSFTIKDSEYKKLEALLAGGKADKKDTKAPVDSITKLKAELREFDKDLDACTDYEGLEACINANFSLIQRCKKELPDWHDADGQRGIRPKMDRLRRELGKLPGRGTFNPHTETAGVR
jgi:hypothetical protein